MAIRWTMATGRTAGTIAAVGNNGVGVVGVNWHARIMAVKFLSSSGFGTTSDAVSAVLYAANNHAKVMNNSWGGGGFSQALKDAISTANASGALFVAAAGNAADDNDAFPNYPSNYDVPNVVAVAATDEFDHLAYFSNYGTTTVDLGAPGTDIFSTGTGVPSAPLFAPSGYLFLSGTSMATPHVSGAAALVLARFPGISVAQLKDRLLNGVDQVGALAGITVTGGRLDVANALDDDTVPPSPVTDLAVTATGARRAATRWPNCWKVRGRCATTATAAACASKGRRSRARARSPVDRARPSCRGPCRRSRSRASNRARPTTSPCA